MSTMLDTRTALTLRQVVDGLVAVEKNVHDDLTVYRWRPRGLPQLPCIYNWLRPSSSDDFDTHHTQDTIVINAHVGIRHSDVEDEMWQLEDYSDAFCQVIDVALKRQQPLGGNSKRARRISMQMIEDVFEEVPVLAIQFPIAVTVTRLVPTYSS